VIRFVTGAWGWVMSAVVASVASVAIVAAVAPTNTDGATNLAAGAVAPPSITREPNVPADDKVSKFRLTHGSKKATFECALQQDGGPIVYSACGANPRYQNLGQFEYCFLAKAIVGGVRSTPASFCWTNYTPATFGIKGSLDQNQRLYPGNAGEAVDLVFENPNNQDITVLEVTVGIADETTKDGEPNPGCRGTVDFEVLKQLTHQVIVPRNSTRSLSELNVPSSAWPVVAFKNLPTNQDACKGTSFTITFTGTASK
jgi:hypothetical protein